ncbi:MAG: hypothetical protein MPJ24_03515 [Pirellulaceae bacterium]|nr:hypothetical protein [Pirellulaceae bacterium]
MNEVEHFWALTIRLGIFSKEQCQQLYTKYRKQGGLPEAASLGATLHKNDLLTKEQLDKIEQALNVGFSQQQTKDDGRFAHESFSLEMLDEEEDSFNHEESISDNRWLTTPTLKAQSQSPQWEEPQTIAERFSKKETTKSPLLWFGAGSGILLVGLLAGLTVFLTSEKPKKKETPSTVNTKELAQLRQQIEEKKKQSGQESVKETTFLPDDGHMLWAPPFQGQPIDLTNVLPGAQVYCVLRVDQLFESPEGTLILRALGPQLESWKSELQEKTKFSLEEFRQIVVSVHHDQDNFLRLGYRIKLKKSYKRADLLGKLELPQNTENRLFQQGETAFWIPKSAEVSTFVLGNPDDVLRLEEAPNVPPLLRRELQKLLQKSDSRMLFTALFSPRYFFGSGYRLFEGDLELLKKPLEDFFGEELQGALLTIHSAENVYAEIRFEGTLSKPARQLVQEFSPRFIAIPDGVEDYLISLTPDPHWRKLAIRIPQMLRFLASNVRLGTEEDQMVSNVILPENSLHNFLAGAELLVWQPRNSNVIITDPRVSATAPSQLTLTKLLEKEFTISFGQKSLELSLQEVEEVVNAAYPHLDPPFEIEILGQDLKEEGITKNQQIRDFDQQGVSLADILTTIVMKGNPVTTVLKANETDQKLVWLVPPGNPSDSSVEKQGRKIIVTTRNAAKRKKQLLPKVFQ